MKGEKKNPAEIIVENKEYIYPSLFYISGLLVGAYLFSFINQSSFLSIINSAFNIKENAFISLFLSRFCVYFSIYILCVFLGMCLVGFPLLNIIMSVSGIETAIKTAYYYVNYSYKGIGFSLLMIIPESAAVATVLIYAIKTSNELSKTIFDIAAKNNQTKEVEIRYYLKQYLIFGLIVSLIALINALIIYLLSGIIKI